MVITALEALLMLLIGAFLLGPGASPDSDPCGCRPLSSLALGRAVANRHCPGSQDEWKCLMLQPWSPLVTRNVNRAERSVVFPSRVLENVSIPANATAVSEITIVEKSPSSTLRGVSTLIPWKYVSISAVLVANLG